MFLRHLVQSKVDIRRDVIHDIHVASRFSDGASDESRKRESLALSRARKKEGKIRRTEQRIPNELFRFINNARCVFSRLARYANFESELFHSLAKNSHYNIRARIFAHARPDTRESTPVHAYSRARLFEGRSVFGPSP